MSDEKTRWPFGGFFLKLSDEKNGTHEYEEYLRNCKENPLTEEEQREWTESARAVIAELEQLNTEPEPTRQAAEAEGISSLQTPEPAELQEGCCTGQEAEVDVVPAEAIVPLGQIGGDAPAEKERWPYASELIGDAFRHWENGRVLLDMGTGRGKNEFIIKRLASWCVDEMLTNGIIGRVLYLCPLNTLHTEKLQRRMEAAIAEADGEPMEIVMTYDMLYESMLEVQTYQHIETKYRNDPASLEKYLAPFKYIVADECHYFTDFSSYGINTYLSLEVLQKAEADHVVIYMSATGEETYKLLEETAKTPEDRIYQLPQDYRHIKQKYFYSRENLVRMPVVNLSYILEESNIDKHYKRVIMDLDPSYWDDDHKGTFGTDTNLLFRLTGNRWITYVEDAALTRFKEETGFVPKLVEMGPGFPVDYFNPPYDETEEATLGENKSTILAFAEKYPLGIEMGRYLAAPCGTYASRVMDIKNNSDTNYIICDGGIHHLKYHGQTMAMQIPEMEVLNTSAETKPYCICGSLCTVADVLVREVELPIVSRNDVILFHRCGAYSVTEGSALFLSRKMPEVYLYNEAVGLEKMRGFISTASINRNSICQG